MEKLNDPGETVTYMYQLSNQQSASANVSFTVNGPTGNLLVIANMPKDGSGVQVIAKPTGPALGTTGIALGNAQVGITFMSSAILPAGFNQSFTWVQVLNSLQHQYITAKGPFVSPAAPESGLDNTYPYTNASPTTTNDSPMGALPATYGEGWETFTATMYLMWDPGLPNGCIPASTVQNADGTFKTTPSNCTSIPVPLSSVTWHWSGCAINVLANQTNGTTWIRSTSNGCPVQTIDNPQASGFPTWTNLITNQ